MHVEVGMCQIRKPTYYSAKLVFLGKETTTVYIVIMALSTILFLFFFFYTQTLLVWYSLISLSNITCNVAWW